MMYPSCFYINWLSYIRMSVYFICDFIYTYHNYHSPSIFIKFYIDKFYKSDLEFLWQERKGSNLRPVVLETTALPTELHSYIQDGMMIFCCSTNWAIPLYGRGRRTRTSDTQFRLNQNCCHRLLFNRKGFIRKEERTVHFFLS